MNVIDKLCAPHLLNVEPYQSARRLGGTGEIWLNANELPFAHDSYQIESSDFHRYPEFQSPALLASYSQYCGLAVDNILCTRGADEGIELMVRAFCRPGLDEIVITPPTYGMYQVSAQMHGVSVRQAARTLEFDLDVDAIHSLVPVKVVFVCSPNNPTGNVCGEVVIRDLMAMLGGQAMVVIDEAYVEFCPEHSLSSLIGEYENLVVVRTLSKAFGLAGLRCGFVLANPEVIRLLSKIIAPYPVPGPVEQIARQVLNQTGLARMRERVNDINAIRDQFVQELGGIAGVEHVLVSFGNFVMVSFADEEATLHKLSEAGIVTRKPYTQGLIEHGIRITIGTPEEMQAVLRALRGQ